MGSSPAFFISAWWASVSRPSRPPCTRGCRVLSRPSRISGNPVKSLTSRTDTPASRSVRAVPPVDRSSIPSRASRRPSSTSPVLSETESSARAGLFTGRLLPQPRLGSALTARLALVDPRRLAQRLDLALAEVAPAAHGQPLERDRAQAHPRDLEHGVAEQLAGRLEHPGPRLGDHHLDPGVLAGGGERVDRLRAHRPAVPLPAAPQPLQLRGAEGPLQLEVVGHRHL